jgi:hypothetical protein
MSDNKKYFYLDKLQPINQVVYLCKQLNIVPLVKDDSVYYSLNKLGVESVRVSSNYILFCFQVRKLDAQLFILLSDELSHYAQWLQRKYKTIVLHDVAFDKDSNYYLNISHQKSICNSFIKLLFYIFDLQGTIYGRKLEMLPCRFNDVIRYVFYKIIYGFRFKMFALPGYFSDIVLLPREEIRRVYIENGFDPAKLKVINSPYIAYLSNFVDSYISVKKDIDVLLFSQPLYYYARGVRWLEEVGKLVMDCANNGMKLVILLHPRDDPAKYDNFADRCEIYHNNSFRSDIENINYVGRSKAVVVKSSSTRILPIMLKVPVVYINYCNVATSTPNLKESYHSDMVLESLGDIGVVFERINQNKKKYIHIQHNNFKSKGILKSISLQPISDAIDSLIIDSD